MSSRARVGEKTRPELLAAYLDGEHTAVEVAQLQARMGALTAFVGGILFEVDRNGRYLAVLTGDPQLLARPVEELYNLNVREVLGEELTRPFLDMFARVIETGNPENMEYSLDVPAGRRNFRCEARPTSMFEGNPDPDAQTVTLLIRDVTEETELKAKLVEAERLAAMGLLAASIGHEIRQPLAFATTSIEVLEREMQRHPDAATDRGREALGHVRDAVRRIAGIAASVGIVAPDRRSAEVGGDQPRRVATTDVRRPVEAAVDLCASELQGRARVVIDIPGHLPRVRVSEGELCQVIANLLLNAAHSVQTKSPPAHSAASSSAVSDRILIRASEGAATPNTVRISVTDDGCGIHPAHVARVFDAFFTTKEPGRGTGLGLFVSRRIIEDCGGLLEIASNSSSSSSARGTTMHVTLPVAENSESDAKPPPLADVAWVAYPQQARSASPSSASTSARPLRVLVIDDEPAFLRSVELVLEDTHDVVVESSSKRALERVRAEPRRFDAILCDLSMPEIDGVTFYAHVEELGIAERFVLMTAGAFTPHGEEFLRQAKCRRIGKPFTLDKLLAMLDSVTSPSTPTQ